MFFFFFSSRRRHTRFSRDWSSDVCSSDLDPSRQRFSALWQGLERIGRLPADLAAKPAGWLVHTLAQDSIEMLVGDVAWYFEQRGPKQNPGPINQEVITSLEAAPSRNSKLIVVAHSMGGNIVYDV